MRPRRILKSVVLLLFAAALAGGYLLIRARCFFPKSDVSITYQIGWWAYKDALTVKTFDVQIDNDRFGGLFNTGEALIQIHVVGEMRHEHPEWRPYIAEAQISERRVVTSDNLIGDIQITPVVEAKDDSTYAANEIVPVDIKIEYVAHALGWGENKYVFSCNQLTQEVVLYRTK